MSLELGVIGNCEIAALVDESARIVWACLPRLDGDPVFCSLLSREGGDAASGVFAVELQHGARSEQRYLRNTAILETLLDDGAGNVLRMLDFCPRFRRRGRFFRPMMFVRIVEAAAGRPVARLRLRPLCDYGAREPETQSGSHHLSFICASARYRLTTDCSLSAIADQSPDRHRPADRAAARARRNRRGGTTAARALAARRHARLLAGLGARALDTGRMAGRGDPRRDHAQALHLRGHGRDGRRAHDFDPGAAEQRSQLGLSLLLAPRQLLRPSSR